MLYKKKWCNLKSGNPRKMDPVQNRKGGNPANIYRYNNFEK